MKLIIIANRLPVRVQKGNDGNIKMIRSEGGLATGLSSLETDVEIHWVGWPGIFTDDPQEIAEITRQLEEMHFHPVFLTDEQIQNYYEGYSNSTIWPLCHYFYTYIEYEARYWDAYREVNRLFSDKTSEMDMRIKQTTPPRRVPRMAARMEMITVTANPSKTSL